MRLLQLSKSQIYCRQFEADVEICRIELLGAQEDLCGFRSTAFVEINNTTAVPGPDVLGVVAQDIFIFHFSQLILTGIKEPIRGLQMMRRFNPGGASAAGTGKQRKSDEYRKQTNQFAHG